MAEIPAFSVSKSQQKKRPKVKSRPSTLKAGRPPITSSKTVSSKPTPSSLSSKHTRTLINSHHLLQRRLATARFQNDETRIHEIEAQLAAQGGLESYQLASRTGQSAQRGGDSSKVLVEWLDGPIRERKEVLRLQSKRAKFPSGGGGGPTEKAVLDPLRILEVGALSTQNALNIPGVTTVRKIDLRSSEDGIEEIDFMELPLPDQTDGPVEWRRGYNVISLSLVLNYVPDARTRGEMLRKTTLFFSPKSTHAKDDEVQERVSDGNPHQALPCLFFVLPAPCLDNSRYLNTERLTALLSSLGYTRLHTKTTRKLHYSLWRYDGKAAVKAWARTGRRTVFEKKEINPGPGRNNFSIVLE